MLGASRLQTVSYVHDLYLSHTVTYWDSSKTPRAWGQSHTDCFVCRLWFLHKNHVDSHTEIHIKTPRAWGQSPVDCHTTKINIIQDPLLPGASPISTVSYFTLAFLYENQADSNIEIQVKSSSTWGWSYTSASHVLYDSFHMSPMSLMPCGFPC